MSKRVVYLLCALGLLCVGCHTPTPSVKGRANVSLDDGLGSLDVVALSGQVGPELLTSSFVKGSDRPLVVAVSPLRSHDGLAFDANIFLRRLRLELNTQAQGKLLFVAQGKEQRALREQVRVEGKSERIQQMLDETAREIVALPELKEGAVVAMLPSEQVNFVNLNAESYLASLRSKVFTASKRKCRFLVSGKLEGADYYLSGMFVADSDKTEGMVNLADWIRDLEKAEREEKSVMERIAVEESTERVHANVASRERTTSGKRYVLRSRMQHEAQMDKQLRNAPRVAKFLNVVLVDAKQKMTIYEKQLHIESLKTGFGSVDYILSAEVADIKKEEAGTKYVLVTIQLIDPKRDVIVWEAGYETKFIQ